ncbi:MAG: ATP-binding protein [Verrucomicrobiota bacterium]
MKLRRQLVLTVLGTLTVTIVLGFFLMAAHSGALGYGRLKMKMALLARTTGAEAAAALAFNQPWAANEVVDRLVTDPEVLAVVVDDREGDEFAGFRRANLEPSGPIAVGATKLSYSDYRVNHMIRYEGENLGSILIVGSLDQLKSEMLDYLLIAGVVCIGSLFLAWISAWLIVGRVAQPIRRLSSAAQKVSEDNDYSQRVKVSGENELSELANSFNEMMETIELQQVQLRKAERLESIGLLASGVAHDLNNLLSPVVGYPEMIAKTLADDDPNRKLLQVMQDSSIRAGEVLQGLLALARRKTASKKPVSLDGVLREVVRSPGLESRLKRFPGVLVRWEPLKEDCQIMGSQAQLVQVFLNLVINAAEAMGEAGGVLTITVVHVDERDEVVVSVHDEGCGIAEDELEEIFEPFHSSKTMADSGTGLGLSIAKRIVEDHEGDMDVRSQVGVGSEFRVRLPAVEAVAKSRPVPLRGQGERVLIVDDMAELRHMLAVMLKQIGYEPIEVESGRNAIAYLENEEVDLVLLDMKMEDDFDGLDTFRVMHEEWPQVPCLLVTGDADSARVREALELGVRTTIAKPFRKEELQVEIGEALREVA